MIPQNANTKITGINTLNEFATAGGILSPNLICNLSICEIVEKQMEQSNEEA